MQVPCLLLTHTHILSLTHSHNLSLMLSLTHSGADFFRPKQHLLPPPPGSDEWRMEEELRQLTGDRLVASSGKLLMLDRLLLRLRSQGSRVLVFSQFVETLDVLQEYLTHRFGSIGEAFLRLDGADNRIMRDLNVRAFNAPGSRVFAFLVSTKAGGMGINLASADSVVLFDSSWNPQVDLQAMDRAHRIGQQKQVFVYRFLTRHSYEEQISAISDRKLLLDHLVIAKRSSSDATSGDPDEDCLYPMNGFEEKKADAVSFTFTELAKALFHDKQRIYNSNSHSTSTTQLDSEVRANLDAELEFLIQNSSCGEGMADLPAFELEGASSDMSSSAPDELRVRYSEEVLEAADQTEHFIFMKELSDGALDGVAVIETHCSSSGTAVVEGEDNCGNAEIVPDSCSDDATRRRHHPQRQRHAPAMFRPTMHRKTGSSTMRVHEDYCFCCDDGGELMECMQCPKVYHPACVGYSEVPAGYWACPWHSCVTCDRKGSSCGGVLFRCMSCPLSYCSECLPSTTTTTPGAGAAELKQLQPPDHFLDGFTRRGFPVPSGSAWVRCRHCSESMEAKQVERLRLQEELRLRSLREAEELRMRDEARMKLTEEYKRRKELKEQEMVQRLRTLKAMREQKEAELRQRRQLQEQMEIGLSGEASAARPAFAARRIGAIATRFISTRE